MAYVEQAADYITGDVVTASEYNQTMSNIIYNHDTSRAFKNRLINGNFIIDQYSSGPFSGTLAAATETYVIDRWYAEATGGTPAGARVAGSGDRQYHYQFTGAASVSALKFGQRIEASNVQDLASTTVTISVYLANSVLTSVGWAVTHADASNNFSSVTAIDSGSWTVDSTMTRYTAEVDLPAGAANGIQLELSVGAQTSGTWTIGNVQLEAGDTATDFDVREVGTELVMCLREAWLVLGKSTGSRYFGTMCYAAATIADVPIRYPVEMRSTPSLQIASGTNYYQNSSNSPDTYDDFLISSANERTCRLLNNTDASGTAGQAYGVLSSNANAYIFLSCPL